LERAKDTPTGFQCKTGDASTVSSAWITIARASARYALSGVWGIPRAKGASVRADSLMIEFEMADSVEGQHSSRATGRKRQALAFYFSIRIRYVFSISKCRGESGLGLCVSSVLAKRMRLRSADFRFKNVFGRRICRLEEKVQPHHEDAE